MGSTQGKATDTQHNQHLCDDIDLKLQSVDSDEVTQFRPPKTDENQKQNKDTIAKPSPNVNELKGLIIDFDLLIESMTSALRFHHKQTDFIHWLARNQKKICDANLNPMSIYYYLWQNEYLALSKPTTTVSVTYSMRNNNEHKPPQQRIHIVNHFDFMECTGADNGWYKYQRLSKNWDSFKTLPNNDINVKLQARIPVLNGRKREKLIHILPMGRSKIIVAHCNEEAEQLQISNGFIKRPRWRYTKETPIYSPFDVEVLTTDKKHIIVFKNTASPPLNTTHRPFINFREVETGIEYETTIKPPLVYGRLADVADVAMSTNIENAEILLNSYVGHDLDLPTELVKLMAQYCGGECIHVLFNAQFGFELCSIGIDMILASVDKGGTYYELRFDETRGIYETVTVPITPRRRWPKGALLDYSDYDKYVTNLNFRDLYVFS